MAGLSSPPGEHHCPGCGAPGVADVFFACRPCWDRLPFAVQHGIITTQRLNLLDVRRRAALEAASVFFRANPARGAR